MPTLPEKFPVVAFTVPPDWLVAVVAVAAFPDVFWVPAAFTPGRFILAVPSKETPPMALGVASAVAVEAFPDTGPEIVVAVKAPTLAEPWTSSVYAGVTVPTPTFPSERRDMTVDSA